MAQPCALCRRVAQRPALWFDFVPSHVTASTAPCPNCGATIEFLWSSAVQTTCAYCRSILVRHDVDLERVGVVGDLPPDSSPIQRGTRGQWGTRRFEVVGRIVYEYGRGTWNEWHLRFEDGTGGWLSDAQLEYACSTLVDQPPRLPAPAKLRPGTTIEHAGERYTVTVVTRARYRGVEGELPFEYWDKAEVEFVDLRTASGKFATVDYSEEPALFFAGEFVAFEALRLVELRTFEGWPVPR
jgi:hypothetical protein